MPHFLRLPHLAITLSLSAVAGCAAEPGLDEADCFANVPAPATRAVLVDGTDPWTPSQIGVVNQAIDDEQRALPERGRLILAIVTADTPTEPRIILSRCRPPDGSGESSLTGNAEIAQADWRMQFREPVQFATAELLQSPTAERSPVVESIAGLTRRADFGSNVPNRSLRLIGDLLQHDPEGFSSYRAPGDEAALERRFAQLEPALTGVQICIDYLRRDSAAAIQGPAHRNAWRRLLTGRGAASVTFTGYSEMADRGAALPTAGARRPG